MFLIVAWDRRPPSSTGRLHKQYLRRGAICREVTPFFRQTTSMKTPIRVGVSHTHQFTVSDQELICFADEQMPAVLSTPSLIWHMEQSALLAAAPHLEDDERTVGMRVDVDHLAPTPPGQVVTCHARVIHVDGHVINFQIDARDEQELIAKGVHKRVIVQTTRFARRVARKKSR